MLNFCQSYMLGVNVRWWWWWCETCHKNFEQCTINQVTLKGEDGEINAGERAVRCGSGGSRAMCVNTFLHVIVSPQGIHLINSLPEPATCRPYKRGNRRARRTRREAVFLCLCGSLFYSLYYSFYVLTFPLLQYILLN